MFLATIMKDEPWTDIKDIAEPSQTTASRFLNILAAQASSRVLLSQHTLTSFEIFPALPSEIRQHIFRLSLPPRVLTLNYDTRNNRFTSSTPPPSLLQVSHEARIAAQYLYHLSFGTISRLPRIYFNPHLDTLYLPRCGEMGYDDNFRDFLEIVADDSRLVDELQKVAIDHVDVDIKRPWEGYNKVFFLRSFKKLQEVVLVACGDSNINTRRDIAVREAVVQFVAPRLSPEEQLQMWWHFRQNFAAEEKVRAEVCANMGRDYEVYKLPTVRIKGKETSSQD